MLNAVWVAVVVAVAFWVVAVCVAVHVMLRAARLIGETTSAVAQMRERGTALAQQAEDVTRRAGEQVAAAQAITASMEEVSTTLADLNRRLRALAPAARTVADGIGAPLAKAAALTYGVSRAVRIRRAPGSGVVRARALTRGEARR
jgi:uncharacterized protein YoxC